MSISSMAQSVYNAYIMIRCCILSALMILVFSACIPGLGPGRTAGPVIHCVVVADPSFTKGFDHWTINIRNVMGRLDRDFEEWFGVRITVDTIIAWEPPDSGCEPSRLMECVLERIPRDPKAVIVHFFRGGGYGSYDVIGLTRPDLSYVAVTQMTNVNLSMHFQYLYNTLYHEFCHMFGAVHVLTQSDTKRLMDAVITQDYVTKTGKELAM
ncbi:MAG: M12 family metallo-peptidase, partial [Fibrobacterota bacterium]